MAYNDFKSKFINAAEKYKAQATITENVRFYFNKNRPK